jgi:hypothetical protein
LLRAVEGPGGGDGDGAVEGVGGDGEEGPGAGHGIAVVVARRLAGVVDEHLDGAEGEHALEGLAHGACVGAVHPEREDLRLGLLRYLLRQLRQLICSTRRTRSIFIGRRRGRTAAGRDKEWTTENVADDSRELVPRSRERIATV